jgi:hypothetical protein
MSRGSAVRLNAHPLFVGAPTPTCPVTLVQKLASVFPPGLQAEVHFFGRQILRSAEQIVH